MRRFARKSQEYFDPVKKIHYTFTPEIYYAQKNSRTVLIKKLLKIILYEEKNI
jgi:hypothetical protein